MAGAGLAVASLVAAWIVFVVGRRDRAAGDDRER